MDCETLQTLNGENEKVRVTPRLLNEELGVIDQARRKRRMVGEFSGTAKNYFFPATVDIFQSTVSLKKGATTSFSTKSLGSIAIGKCFLRVVLVAVSLDFPTIGR